jgi:RNA polymerase sigma factor (sigma-70 family)
MWMTLRKEAMDTFMRGIPHWMSVKDIIHAGWLGYQEGLRRADPSKGDPHQFAKKWAIGQMKEEIMKWYGAGPPRDGVSIIRPKDNKYSITTRWSRNLSDNFYWDQFYVQPDLTEQEIAEQEEFDSGTQKIFLDLLQHLPPAQNEAIRLRYLVGMDTQGVADHMGLTKIQAYKLVYAGLRKLRGLVVVHPFRRRVAA